LFALLIALVFFVPQAFASQLDDNISSEDDIRWESQKYDRFLDAIADINALEGDMVGGLDLSFSNLGEVSDDLTLVITVQDIDGATIADDFLIEYWLTDLTTASTGVVNLDNGIAGAVTTVAASDITVQSGTLIAEHTANAHWILSTGADGNAYLVSADGDVNMDYYWCLQLDGEIATSLTLDGTA